MAGTVDNFLKISVAVSLLGAAGSAGYYYSVYLPARDIQLDRERQLERARAEFARRAEGERAQTEKGAAEEKAAAARATVRINYEACVSRAAINYNQAWAFACKQFADRSVKNRASCTMDKTTCDVAYSVADASPNCSLNKPIATDINADFDKAKDRCLQESRSGLQ